MWEDAKKGTTDTFNYVFDTAPTARPYHETESIPIIELNYRAADVLFSNVSKGELTMESAIFVRRFTNQEDPSDMALFGDVVTQQISDRLVQRGVLIKDGKPNTTDYEHAEGFSASDYQSRSSLSAKQLPPRSAMLTGTYTIGTNFVYLSAKVTRLTDSAVVSAHNWTIPVSDNVRQLLPQLKSDDGLTPSVKTKFE